MVAGLQLPNLSPKRTRIWLIQVEARFHLQSSTSLSTKYLYIVVALPPDIADVIDGTLPSVLAKTRILQAEEHRSAVPRHFKRRQTGAVFLQGNSSYRAVAPHAATFCPTKLLRNATFLPFGNRSSKDCRIPCE